jgi:hypothetical protein
MQLEHNGANPDSVQVGNGTNVMAVNASLQAEVHDTDLNALLTLLNAKFVTGTDIGDVTINNAAGAAAVNIQDGGNSITVDALNLDIRDLTHVSDSVSIGDGVEIMAINASLEAQVRDDDANTALGTVNTNLGLINAKFGSLGQKASAASAPVVLSSEQEVILTAIQTAVEIIDNAIAGTEMQVDIVDGGLLSTEATLAAQSAKFPAALGSTTSAASLSVTLASDEADIGMAQDDVLTFDTLDISGANITFAGYTELVADIGATAGKQVHIFTSTGEPLVLAIGAVASEADKMIIFPGGSPHAVTPVTLPANARLSLRKLTAGTVSAGFVHINVMG